VRNGFLRLVVWNIHKGIGGLDRRYAPERIATVLHHHRPDVVALQEVDDGVPRSRGHAQATLLADMLGFRHVAFGPNVRLKRGCYGNATLSHFPIVRQQNLDISFPMKKPRGALLTDIDVPAGAHALRLHLVNLHLGLSGVERRWQVRRLLLTESLRRLDGRSRIVVAGDTNDWGGALPGGRLREAGFTCATGRGRRALRTFPAWSPVGALDRAFLRGPLRLEHCMRSRLGLAGQASDHLPLVLDLVLEPSA